MRKEVDFLVLGSGIAGLTFALKVAEHGSVLVVTKADLDESATKYAQGGIAAVTYKPDTYEKHIEDTLKAGRYLNDSDIVRMTIEESTDRISELIEWGTQFDRFKGGRLSLGREGGHSERRVLHHKDSTGNEIERSLINRVKNHPNIHIWKQHFALDIITQHHLGEVVTRRRKDTRCYGAYILNRSTNEIHTVLSKNTLVATGGVGCTYASTTNPPVSTGDGIAMAYRAKAVVKNMEFVQFHPTALYNPKASSSFLITEALRGFGAVLKNIDGATFMEKYHEMKSLAPRDIVARAIDSEMKTSGVDHLYLDCRHLNHDQLINKFPKIFAKCLSLGIDIRNEMIPVVPSAHYLCGGIKTDSYGQSSIQNLYATGECAFTGLHGANRLASNSLLEAAVFSHRAAKKAVESLTTIPPFPADIPEWNSDGTVLNEELVLITQSLNEVQLIMSNYVGIVRSDLRLSRALSRLALLYQENEALYQKSVLSVPLCELRNIIVNAYLIIKMAQDRKENIGLHYSIDHINK